MINELLSSSVYFGAGLTILCFFIGSFVQKKTGFILCNSILIAFILVILFLKVTGIEYEYYENGARYITWFLNLATISRAILLYEQLESLKKNYAAILVGITAGAIATMLGVLAMAVVFNFSHIEYVTFLPKSVTTAMGIALSEEYGGLVPMTVIAILATGLSGNIFGALILKLLHVTEPVARGIALGTASHAIGSARAWEMGEIEGAMGSLAIAVNGLITCVVAAFFCTLY